VLSAEGVSGVDGKDGLDLQVFAPLEELEQAKAVAGIVASKVPGGRGDQRAGRSSLPVVPIFQAIAFEVVAAGQRRNLGWSPAIFPSGRCDCRWACCDRSAASERQAGARRFRDGQRLAAGGWCVEAAMGPVVSGVLILRAQSPDFRSTFASARTAPVLSLMSFAVMRAVGGVVHLRVERSLVGGVGLKRDAPVSGRC
jgi:hypothetical protein